MPSYRDFLAAKKSVDDRALNRYVLERLRTELGERPRVLEVGAGLGTMVARLVEWKVLRQADYGLLDVDPGLLSASGEWLREWAVGVGLEACGGAADLPWGAPRTQEALRLRGAEVDVRVHCIRSELGEYLEGGQEQPGADLLIANAFLDLVEVPAMLPGLFRIVRPGGLCWFSVNFDGHTILQPEHPADERFMQAYHQTMDERVRYGRPAGESRTGRHLFGHLQAEGAELLAAGSSDWVVFPGPAGYPGQEALFLHFLLDTMEEALRGRVPDPERREWLALRRGQVEQGKLVLIAHQLDFLSRTPA